MKQQYQGDVSLIQCEEVNKAAEKIQFKPIPQSGIVVALGEITGHSHRIVKEREDVVVEFGQDERGFYFRCPQGGAKIVHEEHGIQVLNPGITFVGSQWEYNDLNDRKVID